MEAVLAADQVADQIETAMSLSAIEPTDGARLDYSSIREKRRATPECAAG